MSRLQSYLEKVVPLSQRLSQQRHLKSVSQGLMMVMPLALLGSVFQIIAAFPEIFTFLPAYPENIKSVLTLPYTITFGLFAVVSAVTVAYFYAKIHDLHPISLALISLVSFVLISAPITETGGLDTSFFGSAGMFVAIFVGLISGELQRLLDKRLPKLKLPDTIPPVVADTFQTIIPMFVIVSLFYGLSLLAQAGTGQMIPPLVMSWLSPALVGSESIFFAVAVAGLINLLSWFGVHGFNALAGIILPILLANTAANAEAYAAGEAATKIFTFPMMAMAGTFFWIIPLIFLRARSQQLRSMGKIGLGPAIFGIVEPLQYGTPIMLNPILGIPFVLYAMVNQAIVWCFMYFGWMNTAVVNASAYIPFPFMGYVATLDARAFLLVLIIPVVSYVIWKPFVAVYDRQLVLQENASREAVADA